MGLRVFIVEAKLEFILQQPIDRVFTKGHMSMSTHDICQIPLTRVFNTPFEIRMQDIADPLIFQQGRIEGGAPPCHRVFRRLNVNPGTDSVLFTTLGLNFSGPFWTFQTIVQHLFPSSESHRPLIIVGIYLR